MARSPWKNLTCGGFLGAEGSLERWANWWWPRQPPIRTRLTAFSTISSIRNITATMKWRTNLRLALMAHSALTLAQAFTWRPQPLLKRVKRLAECWRMRWAIRWTTHLALSSASTPPAKSVATTYFPMNRLTSSLKIPQACFLLLDKILKVPREE